MTVATSTLQETCINTIRGLSMDAVQAANSGHPGLPMGAAPMAFALWNRHLRHNPKNPKWFDRDRFILSAGHGSMLLYSLLHLTGYDLSLDEIKNFRQWGSKTPGHPENFMTPGVEMATGPLGQGFATGVGFAIAERFLGATFNKPGHTVVDHYTYAIVSDGDLMEGISSEAASLAGHLKLGKMIYLYDDNQITIDGSTSLAFTEDVQSKFNALGWHTVKVDGMDVDAVDAAIVEAQKVTEKPSLILCKTIIGYGSPNKQGTAKTHGSPLGEEEVKLSKERLGIPVEPLFYIADEALNEFRKAVDQGGTLESEWAIRLDDYCKAFPTEGQQLRDAIDGKLGTAWLEALGSVDEKIASRSAGGKVINMIAPHLPTLLGGSADLAGSVMTNQIGVDTFQPETPAGRNFCYGVREHGMAAALNGITLHGGCRAFGGTFLMFSDYCRPAVRLAALMECPSIFIFTHDSIGLGEDGPTHQPIEHVMALRTIPNLNVWRPADGNETAACWKVALESHKTPTCMILSRQNLASLSPNDILNHPAQKGAYVLREASTETPKCILAATGSEVQLAVAAQELLEKEGISTRVVSMPSWFDFEKQSPEYRASVFPTGVPTVSIECGTTLGWSRYAEAHVGIDRFGASAPGDLLMEKFGFTTENVIATVKKLL